MFKDQDDFKQLVTWLKNQGVSEFQHNGCIVKFSPTATAIALKPAIDLQYQKENQKEEKEPIDDVTGIDEKTLFYSTE